MLREIKGDSSYKCPHCESSNIKCDRKYYSSGQKDHDYNLYYVCQNCQCEFLFKYKFDAKWELISGNPKLKKESV